MRGITWRRVFQERTSNDTLLATTQYASGKIKCIQYITQAIVCFGLPRGRCQELGK